MAAILLDRDGVINENRDAYVTHWQDFRFVPRSLEALTSLRAMGYRLAVVTNQSAVGRGLLTSAALQEIHERMRAECAASRSEIEAIFVCPHTPEDGCECRKPRPALLRWAMAALGERPASCVAIGDSLADLQAAEAAGVPFVLVRTGKGEETLRDLTPEGLAKVHIVRDLWEARDAVRVHLPPSGRRHAA